VLAFAIKYMLIPDHALRRNAWECLDGTLRFQNMAKTECASPPNEAGSLADSNGLGDGDKSESITLESHLLVGQHHLASSRASTIRAPASPLDDRGNEAVDALIGLAPPGLPSFEHPAVDTPGAEGGDGGDPAPMPAWSMMEGGLWGRPALDKNEAVEGNENEGKEEEREGDSDCDKRAQGGMRVLREAAATVSLAAEGRPASRYKRSLGEEPSVDDIDGANIAGQADVLMPSKKTRR
jgi:hypothetical protein